METIGLFRQDFGQYYSRAKILQYGKLTHGHDWVFDVDDPLMENIPIYDTVERCYAGFSNMIQQMWYGSDNPKKWHAKPEYNRLKKVWTKKEWLYAFLVHRVTGSGASFEKDHGFRNTILPDLADCDDLQEMIGMIRACDVPMFTSIGNQPPPFPKPKFPYKTAGKYYLCEIADSLITDLNYCDKFGSIRECVDWILDWHVKNGCKRYVFVLTAYAMDLATYFPEMVPSNSKCYYGSNCIRSMKLMGAKNLLAQDMLMEFLCEKYHALPMDMEDVLCDYIRYITEYIPKGYKFHPNNSLLKGYYGSDYKARIEAAVYGRSNRLQQGPDQHQESEVLPGPG